MADPRFKSGHWVSRILALTTTLCMSHKLAMETDLRCQGAVRVWNPQKSSAPREAELEEGSDSTRTNAPSFVGDGQTPGKTEAHKGKGGQTLPERSWGSRR